MKHALLEYEQNLYHDSYFYAVFFDDATGTIGSREIGATAYAGGGYGDIVRHAGGVPADVLENARQALARFIFGALREAEHRDVLTPNSVAHGEVLRVLTDSIPRSKSKYAAGQTGEVFWSQAIGRFYRNGYNKPGRDNIRVGLRLADGARAFLPLKVCRLNREVLSDAELQARAQDLSHDYRFECAGGCTSWPSELFFTKPDRRLHAAAPVAA